MDILRDAINDWHGTQKMLAIRCGFSETCIKNIASGKTIWPRPLTFDTLCLVLGLEMTLRRKNRPDTDADN